MFLKGRNGITVLCQHLTKDAINEAVSSNGLIWPPGTRAL